jgi:60 kDa SS-A/Ro ribonucleoprotein
LRNMQSAGVEKSSIENALRNMKVERVLPFRFVTAARYAPHLEPALEEAMLKCLAGQDVLKGKTLLLVDVSGSMDGRLSGKSEMTCIDAACGLAILAREICENTEIMTFSNSVVDVPTRRGFALRDAINKSQQHSGTYLGKAIEVVNKNKTYDRIIVFTDEQSADRVPAPAAEKAYMVNVASYKNGVGYGAWRHIDGFSENILTYIHASENESI